MAKNKIVLCDTNILIELSKSNIEVVDELRSIGSANIAVSSVSAGELIVGALNKNDLNKIKKALAAIQVVYLNETISLKSIELLETYSLSHGLDIPDSLIAATALINELQLYTLNLKHFKFIKGLRLYPS